MSKKKDYLETFQEEQENQYMPWKYPTTGRPTPFEEGKGNKKMLAIFYFVGSGVCFVGAPVMSILSSMTSYGFRYDFTSVFMPLICLFPFGIIFLFAGVNHLKKHKQILEARKQQAQNAPRKKRKKKKR